MPLPPRFRGPASDSCATAIDTSVSAGSALIAAIAALVERRFAAPFAWVLVPRFAEDFRLPLAFSPRPPLAGTVSSLISGPSPTPTSQLLGFGV